MYSDKTHRHLNYLTLQINNSDIKAQYDEQRVEYYKSLQKPAIIFNLLWFVTKILNYFEREDRSLYTFDRALIILIYSIGWLLTNIKHKKYAPILSFALPLLFDVYVLLSYTDNLPYDVSERDFKENENLLLLIHILFVIVNRTTFLQTALVIPVTYCSTYYV
jgi:hypothetical protein